MFCEKCGNEVNENESICPHCGAVSASSVGSDDKYSSNNSDERIGLEPITGDNSMYQPEKPKKSGIKKYIAFGGIIVLLLIGSLAVFANAFDFFKSPKQLYLEIEGKNIMSLVNETKDGMKENYNKSIKPLLEKTSETKVEYSASADLSLIPGVDPYSASMINDLLDNSKIVVSTKSNPKDKQNITDLSLFLKGSKLIDSTLLNNKDQVAVSVPALYSKYLLVNLNEINSVMEKFGMPSDAENSQIPKKIITNEDIQKVIKIDEAKFMNIVKNYGKVLSDSISDEQVTMEKGIEFKVNDLDFKARKLTVQLDEEQFKGLVIKMFEAMENDQDLYDLTVQNMINVFKLYEEAGYNVSSNGGINLEEELSRDNFKKSLSEFKENLKGSLDEVSISDGVKMSIYVDGDNIIGRTVDMKIKTPDLEEPVNVSVNYSGVSEYKNKNISNLEIKASGKGIPDVDEVSLKTTYDTTIDKNNGSETGKSNITVGLKGQSISADLLKADIDITKGDTEGSKKYSYKYDVVCGVPMVASLTAEGKLDMDVWEKDKEKKSGSDVTFSIDANLSNAPDQKIAATVNVKTENTFDVDFEFPEFDSTNSVDIGKADENQLGEVMMEVQMSMQKFFEDNQELIEMFMQY